MKHILLIAGGWSAERAVSLAGAKELQTALVKRGYKVTLYDPKYTLDDLPDAVKNVDFSFINLHGSPGEDGLVQAMLDQLKIPYQGSGAAASILSLDKAAAKILFKNAGLHIAPSIFLAKKPPKGWNPPFSFPVFIKSNTGGSSLNLVYVASSAELDAALDRFFSQGGTYLLEQAVKGIEVTCGILGQLHDGQEVPFALPPVLIKANNESGLFDYTSKYSPGGAEEICPAPLAREITHRVQQMSLTAHETLGLSGYSRSDFIIPDDGLPVLLEVNTLPGLTSTSLVPKEINAIGLGFEDFIERLIALGLQTTR